ncbi:MAG: RpiB/LacA/LacB family sugar-phosphate isomerase [Anaerolineae bacterium]|nr:RpiB/LacA/LacB family sugar-phosphate isomerase [Anaerolineae bacterium]
MADKSKPIIVGADQNGWKLKDTLRDYLISKGYSVIDMGVNSDEPVLYPEVAVKLSEKIRDGVSDRGILVCGTGAGMAIVANKVPGVRAVCIHDGYTAERARASNDAQVVTLGSQVIGPSTAKKMIDIWLESEFEGGRSLPKVNMIKEMDNKR